MVDYRELCESVMRKPPFSNAKLERALGLMCKEEVKCFKEHKEVYAADNEKWHELWLSMLQVLTDKISDGGYYSGSIGCNQYRDLIAPLKDQIIGRTQ